jgi:hypothetical protein
MVESSVWTLWVQRGIDARPRNLLSLADALHCPAAYAAKRAPNGRPLKEAALAGGVLQDLSMAWPENEIKMRDQKMEILIKRQTKARFCLVCTNSFYPSHKSFPAARRVNPYAAALIRIPVCGRSPMLLRVARIQVSSNSFVRFNERRATRVRHPGL